MGAAGRPRACVPGAEASASQVQGARCKNALTLEMHSYRKLRREAHAAGFGYSCTSLHRDVLDLSKFGPTRALNFCVLAGPGGGRDPGCQRAEGAEGGQGGALGLLGLSIA
jgi:hypothetical protein